MKKSAWKDWKIRITFGNEPLKTIPHTVKARSKEEAEDKAQKYLSGRGALLFEVCEL